MGDLRAAPVVGPSGRGSAPPSRPNDLNSTTKITHSIFFYPSVSTFTSAADTKYDEFHDLVKGNGWERLRQSGSHVIYRKGSRTYPVPYHKGKELGKGLENKMKKDMGLK